jgi:hypothetical protein
MNHAAWSPPATSTGDPRVHPSLSRSAWPIANHLPRRRPSPTSTLRWPSTACASFECQAPTSGRRRAVVDTAGDHAARAIPAMWLPAYTTPATSFPLDTADAATHGHRTPDAGRWRPDSGHLDAPTPAPDTGHLDRPRGPPDARIGHRDTSCQTQRGHGDDRTAGIRTSLATTRATAR